MNVGIVGAGIAGLACAARLAQSGIAATLFDKGAKPGGRLSTLDLDCGTWDFGAQFIESVDGPFAAQLARWAADGVVAPWPDGPVGSLVPVPHMRSLVEALAASADVRFGHKVDRVASEGGQWTVAGRESSAGPFAALVIATPAEQAAPLLSLHDLVLAREAAAVRSTPCWSVMIGFAQPLANVPPVMADCGDLAWAARNSSKPLRGPGECWVIEGSAEWSRRHLEADRDDVATRLLGLFAAETGVDLPDVTFLKAHRWRFARPHATAGRVLWNADLNLGACGDWCTDATISGAWLSGTALGERIAAQLEAQRPALKLA